MLDLNKRLVIILLIVGVALVCSPFLVLNYWNNNSKEKSNIIFELRFKKTSEKLFFIARNWGVSGNHDKIILTNKCLDRFDMYTEYNSYIFYTSELYYKMEGNDSLVVYADKSTMPINQQQLVSTIKIKIIDFKDYDENKDYEINYKKYGLTRVRSY